MRSTRKYGRRNRSRRTKKNRLYGGADKTEPVLDGEKLQYLFDTSPNKNFRWKKNPNKFTVEVRNLATEYVNKLPKDGNELQKYIIKITGANNKSVYCTSTQDFKETINKKFHEITENKLFNLILMRNKTRTKRMREKLDKGLDNASMAVSSGVGAVSSGVGAVSSGVGAVSSGVGKGLGNARRAVSSGVGKVINTIRGRSNQPPDNPGSSL
jgi:X-X-X-Leu-X-X-Gly heptad repeat protein